MNRRRACLLGLAVVVLAAIVAGAVTLWRSLTSRPDSLLRRGQEAVYRKDYDDALRLANRLEAAGALDEAHLLRGQAYLHQRLLNEAILEYNEIRHDNEEVLTRASLIYGLGFLSLKRYVEAENLLQYVVSVRPDNVDAHRGLARIHYDRGAMTGALEHLKKWSEASPQDGEPLRWMGLVYDGLGANGLAAEHYRRALARDLSPRLRAEATFDLAEVLLKSTEYAEALACLDSHDLQPLREPAELPELRAECLYGLGRLAEAIQVLDEVLAVRPSAPRALRVRAQIHISAGETTAAVPLLERVLQATPHDCTCRYQLAQAYEALGRRTDAAEQRRRLEESQSLLRELSDLNEEASRRPTDVAVRLRLVEVCEKLNKHDLARMWRRAADACPNQATP